MKSTPFLELLAEMVPRLHASESPGKLNVVALGMENTQSYQELFEAFALTEDGFFVRADTSSTSVRGIVDRDLKTHLESEAFVNYGTQDGNLTLKIRNTGDLIETLINNQIPPTDGSGKTLASIINAVFELAAQTNDSPEREVACLVYKDAGLDLKTRERIWQFLTQDVVIVGIGKLKHLIVIVDSDYINIDPYCITRPSVTYIVNGSELKRRRTSEQNERLAREIARKGREKFLVLFLGAGFSASSNLPLGNALRDFSIKHQLGAAKDFLSTPSMLAKKYLSWLVQNGYTQNPQERDITSDFAAAQLTLERVMIEELRASSGRQNSVTLLHFEKLNSEAQAQLGKAVHRLKAILSVPFRKIILVTVNFDTLVESVAGDNLQVFADDSQFAQAAEYIPDYIKNGGKVPYLKLHGTINDRNTILADFTRTMGGISPETKAALDSILPPLAASVQEQQLIPWAFVGCSMRDRDLTPYFNGGDFVRRVDEFWVGPFIDQSVYDFAENPRRVIWMKRESHKLEERCVTETADLFLDHFSELWLAED